MSLPRLSTAPLPKNQARGISLPMPVYLIIEERDGDELRSYAKYDITEPRETSLIRIGENSALEVRCGRRPRILPTAERLACAVLGTGTRCLSRA
jgi:hypothetical protein